MNQEQLTSGYDEYMSLPPDEQNILFGQISVENCASIMKTHVERWLAANHSRLSQEQIAVIEEFISSIKPESYQAKRNYVQVMQKENTADENDFVVEAKRNYEKVTRIVEKLYAKAEAVFSREDVMQFMFLSGGQCSSRRI